MSYWFRPVCDDLLRIIVSWHANYERGEVESDRKWLNLDGVVVDRPTRYAHRIAFRPIEVEYLLQIMRLYAPQSEVINELVKLSIGLRRGRLLPGGRYLVTIAYWKQDLREMLVALLTARDGQVVEIGKPRTDGKDLFEV